MTETRGFFPIEFGMIHKICRVEFHAVILHLSEECHDKLFFGKGIERTAHITFRLQTFINGSVRCAHKIRSNRVTSDERLGKCRMVTTVVIERIGSLQHILTSSQNIRAVFISKVGNFATFIINSSQTCKTVKSLDGVRTVHTLKIAAVQCCCPRGGIHNRSNGIFCKECGRISYETAVSISHCIIEVIDAVTLKVRNLGVGLIIRGGLLVVRAIEHRIKISIKIGGLVDRIREIRLRCSNRHNKIHIIRMRTNDRQVLQINFRSLMESNGHNAIGC